MICQGDYGVLGGFWEGLLSTVKTYRKGLKIPCSSGRAGSSPASGTIFQEVAPAMRSRAPHLFLEERFCSTSVPLFNVTGGEIG